MNQHVFSFATIITTATLVAHTIATFAQQDDVALAHVKYGFVHIDDTTLRDQPHEEDMMLYIGASSAMYKSFSMAERIAEAQAKTGPQEEMGANVRSTSQSFIIDDELTGNTLYLLPGEKKAVYVDQIGTKPYIIPTSYADIDWQIGTDTKEIGGYLCQQATGRFGGRTYTAWFTTELPFPFGPWKLHGLPGLILEAQDATGDVTFSYQGFDKESGPGIPMGVPEDASETTEKAFEKAKSAFMADPAGSLLRTLDIPEGAAAQVVYKDENGNEISAEEAKAMLAKAQADTPVKQVNNPLELDHKSSR